MNFYLERKTKEEEEWEIWIEYIRVRPGLDSRLDILDPPLEPTGILDRALVGVRNVDGK